LLWEKRISHRGVVYFFFVTTEVWWLSSNYTCDSIVYQHVVTLSFPFVDLTVSDLVLFLISCNDHDHDHGIKALVQTGLPATCATGIWFVPSWSRLAVLTMMHRLIATLISIYPIVILKVFPYPEEIESWQLKSWRQSNLAKADSCKE
jgi:hypothetical protein